MGACVSSEAALAEASAESEDLVETADAEVPRRLKLDRPLRARVGGVGGIKLVFGEGLPAATEV